MRLKDRMLFSLIIVYRYKQKKKTNKAVSKTDFDKKKSPKQFWTKRAIFCQILHE